MNPYAAGENHVYFFRQSDLDKMSAVDNWLDDYASQEYKDQPLAQDWARVAKLQEEEGEAIDALIGFTGQNPRKGTYSSREDLLKELADRALTAIYAIQHFTKDSRTTASLIGRRLTAHHDRMSQDIASRRSHP